MTSRAHVAVLCVATVVGLACDESGPLDVAVPAFVFVSGDQQDAELYLWSADTVTRLTSNSFADGEPHVAAGRLVFTSERDTNPEVYIADVRAMTPRRLTIHASTDGEPALNPAGDRIVFVSMRSGTPRLWTMDTLGGALQPLTTGSATFIPERAPAWSPHGDRIAFTSTRTGTSQVFVVDATGGVATQLTSEAGGAFDPAWTVTGTEVVYAAIAGTPRLRRVPSSGGDASDYAAAADTALGEPSCSADFCVVVRGAYGAEGDLIAYGAPRSERPRVGVPPRPRPAQTSGARVLVERAGNDRQPAVVAQ